jgi:SAM-dependent methyltransferase
MTVPDDHRTESRARWARSAAGWETHRDRMRSATMPVSVWMIDALELQPGHELLELAAGIGDVGFLAAELIAPGGTLISSDFVPEMLSAAQARAQELGIENVRFRQIDAAQAIDQPAASLDAVLCRWGYMLMADPENALHETRRILRPGGRVSLAAWTGPADNPWASTPMRELVGRGIVERPDPEAPGQFAWAPEGLIADRLDGAGFGEARVEVVDFAMTYPSFETWIDTQRDLAPSLRDALDGLDPAARGEVLAAVRLQATPYTLPDGSMSFPARTWVAAAAA